MRLPIFCDWLKVADSAVTSQPSAWRSKIMRTDGKAVDWERIAWVDIRGTSSEERCSARFLDSGELVDGIQRGYLHLDGNLGRFGARHNLFGVHVQDAPGKVLRLLEQSTGTAYENPQALALRRVDLTCNFSFASAADASAFLDWSVQHRLGRAQARRYPTGCSWVTENWSAKVYDKLADLRRHNLSDLADEIERKAGHILRLELTLRTDELRRFNVDTIEKWTPEMENVIFSTKFAPILRGENLPTLDALAENLPTRIAANLQAWRNGMDFQAAMRDRRMSRATYYRLRAELLPHGVDIAERCNVHTLAIRPRLIEMRPFACPDWVEVAA